jgi:AraC-like DNA-binding protein
MNESPPDIERIARRLAMTPRTLQRRLRQEETSFAAVLEELRRDMAPSLLREGRMSVSEVAFLLGYEDPSSFQRAFRRWFGVSPRAFRATTR